MACFVLTGAGVDAAGVACKRDDIVDVLESMGHNVIGSVVHGLDYLVASRTDTKKADDAAKKGVLTITYQQMWDLVNTGSIDPVGWGIVEPAMDQASVEEQMKHHPLFGSF